MDKPELKIIDVFICKLRKKLADASAGRNYIETVWGRGYVLLKAAIALKPRWHNHDARGAQFVRLQR